MIYGRIGHQWLVLVIGGIARLVLLEVLCRAFTVVEGHPYHNE